MGFRSSVILGGPSGGAPGRKDAARDSLRMSRSATHLGQLGAPDGNARYLASFAPVMSLARPQPKSPTGARLEPLSSPPIATLSPQRLMASASEPQLPRPGTADSSEELERAARSREAIQKRRSVMELLANPDLESIVKHIFAKYDTDDNRQLNIDDLHIALGELYVDLGLSHVDQASALRLFKKYDVDNSGFLEFTEFFELFQALLRMQSFDKSIAMGRECFVSKHQGDVWATYEKLRELGTGSFGTAYLVKHKRVGEERVVKAVKKSRVKLPVEDVEKEILVMRQCDHPHIIRLRRWYEDKRRIYLVLDALKGGTLRDVILEVGNTKQRGLKEDWIRTVMSHCISAMAYCHHLRLIHKDLKDENIMLLKKDQSYDKPFAVIIDLGLAEMFNSQDPTGQQVGGTPTTMAPEVWAGTFGPKCDVWSLGVVLYEMLTGQMPFMLNCIEPQAWIRLHKRGCDLTLIKTSAPGKALCKLMLSFSESKRPTMKECTLDAWFKTERHQLRAVDPVNFANLQSFCNASALKRGVLMELASKLPMDQAEEIVDLFKSFDTDGDGRVSITELKEAFKTLGLGQGDLAERTFQVMDLDNDGYLAFTEFASMVLVMFKDLMEDRLHKMMAEHDADGDNRLEAGQVDKFLADVTDLIDKDPNKKSRSTDALAEIKNKSKESISYKQLKSILMGLPETPMASGPARAPARGGRVSPAMSVTGTSLTPPMSGSMRRSVQFK